MSSTRKLLKQLGYDLALPERKPTHKEKMDALVHPKKKNRKR